MWLDVKRALRSINQSSNKMALTQTWPLANAAQWPCTVPALQQYYSEKKTLPSSHNKLRRKTVLFLLGRNIPVVDFANPWKQYDAAVSKHPMYKQLSTNTSQSVS